MQSTSDWSAQQLAEFLAVVSGCNDAVTAGEVAVERAAEAIDAEVGALVRDDDVVVSIGFRTGEAPIEDLIAVVREGGELRVAASGRARWLWYRSTNVRRCCWRDRAEASAAKR